MHTFRNQGLCYKNVCQAALTFFTNLSSVEDSNHRLEILKDEGFQELLMCSRMKDEEFSDANIFQVFIKRVEFLFRKVKSLSVAKKGNLCWDLRWDRQLAVLKGKS